MVKFVKRHHYKKGEHKGAIVITYTASEIIIGILLITLVGFYVYNYLYVNLYGYKGYPLYPSQILQRTQSTKTK